MFLELLGASEAEAKSHSAELVAGLARSSGEMASPSVQ